MRNPEEYCQCDYTTPRSHTGNCWVCGLRILFPCEKGVCKPIEARPIPFHEAWEALEQAYRDYHRHYGEGMWNTAKLQAIDNGLLTYGGGYELFGCNMNLCPKTHSTQATYFTSLEGAIKWRKLDMSNAQYSVELRKVEVIPL